MRRVVLVLAIGCAPPVPGPNPVDPAHDFDRDGLSEDEGDCDDEDAEVGAPPEQYVDADGDGLVSAAPVADCADEGGTEPGPDCDDADPAVAFDRCWTPEDEGCGGPTECRLDGVLRVQDGYPLTFGPTLPVDQARVRSGSDLDGDGLVDVILGGDRRYLDPQDWLRVMFSRRGTGAEPALYFEARDLLMDLPGTEGGHTHGIGLSFGGAAGADLAVVQGGWPYDELVAAWILFDGAVTTTSALADQGGNVLTIFPDPDSFAGVGMAIAAGDLGGDGLDDLILAGPSFVGRAHELFVVEGGLGPGQVSLEDQVRASIDAGGIDMLGTGVAFVPDLDGAGTRAVALVSQGSDDPSELFVFLAEDVLNGVLADPWARFTSDSAACCDVRNPTVAWGDLDGDGYGDLAYGRPGTNAYAPDIPFASGVVDLVLAPAPGAAPVGEAAIRLDSSTGNVSCGTGVEVVDGLFGPGVAGLVASCPDVGYAGAVHLVPGVLGPSTLEEAAVATIDAALTPGVVSLGRSISAAQADVDGDGGPDFVVGSFVDGSDAAEAFLFSGGILAP